MAEVSQSELEPRPGIDLRYLVQLPPERAVEYLRSKGVEVTATWTDLWEEAHRRAFTVAGVASEDLLADIKATVAKSIKDGQPYKEAADALEDVMESHGWTGKKHRIATILETNTATAYAEGRHERQIATRASRPYWEYVAKLDAVTRPSHAALDGKVWRADDPIWRTIYPPNGYNCRCRVRALTDEDIEERGLAVNTKSSVRRVESIVSRNRTTGAETRRPVSIARWTDANGERQSFRPDPGWGHAPGDE